MKTKSTRKRLLVSSVAMLLVAMLALGTATYAWFTSNPLASASGLNMKATASKGLVIQTATHGAVNSDFWGHTDYLNCNAQGTASKTDSIEIAPVSFDLSSTDSAEVDDVLGSAYTVEAAADNASTAKTDGEVSNPAAGSFYSEEIACKLTGTADADEKVDLKMTGLTITANNVTQKAGMRVAVEYNGKLIGVYSPTEATNNYLTAPEGYISGTTKYSAFTKTAKTFNAYSGTTLIGKVGTAGTDKVKVTVYLDGENSSVYSTSIAAGDIISKVEINLSVAP